MSNEEHRRAASLVNKAVSSLNSALLVAQDVGLYVELNDVPLETFGRRHRTRVYHAIIETREPVGSAILSSPQQETRE